MKMATMLQAVVVAQVQQGLRQIQVEEGQVVPAFRATFLVRQSITLVVEVVVLDPMGLEPRGLAV
jgi:hypothetical protein